jgi:hypothetical protein
MTVKLYVRNDGPAYVGINTAAGDPKDVHLIRPGDAKEVIFADEADTEVSVKNFSEEDVTAAFLLKYPVEPKAGDTTSPAVTLHIYAFTDDRNAMALIPEAEEGLVKVGDILTLTQTGGAADTLPAGIQATVTNEAGVELTLDLDLSKSDVEGLTADAVVTPV